MALGATFAERFSTSWGDVGAAVVSTAAIFAAVIIATRLAGLRSFSKMSAFDFAMTVAVGSLIASVAVTQAPLPVGLVGLAMLYLLQVVVALLRRRTAFEQAVDNSPVLLMLDGRFLDDAMRAARITRADLRAKLREANALRYSQVRAVVLETTGDISVLHGDDDVEVDLLRGVRGGEHLLGGPEDGA